MTDFEFVVPGSNPGGAVENKSMDVSSEQAEKLIVGLPPLTTILEETITIVEDELDVIDKELLGLLARQDEEMSDLLGRRGLACSSITNNLTHVADEIDKVFGQEK